VGDAVTAGEPLAFVHAARREDVAHLARAFRIEEDRPEPRALVQSRRG
jgi:thymidine phosphorylase